MFWSADSYHRRRRAREKRRRRFMGFGPTRWIPDRRHFGQGDSLDYRDEPDSDEEDFTEWNRVR